MSAMAETKQPGLEPDPAMHDPVLSPAAGGTEILLIRHGDALPDAAEVVLDGKYDSQPLSALGRNQALALADRLRHANIDAIYSSPIPRARQTAAPLAEALGIEILEDDDLREVRLGPVGPAIPPGASGEQIAAALRERLRSIRDVALVSGLWSDIPGSEPSEALKARATTTIAAIAATHPGQRLAIFSHAALINAYLAAMLGISRDFFFPCANTSISTVRLKGERRLLIALNDVAHLHRAGLIR
jgi:broad specificity phosphatase PhoE